MPKKIAEVGVGAMTPKKRTVEYVPGDDLPTYYANNIAIDLTSFDVRLRLGQIQGGTETTLQIKNTAQVFMSHQHFRALVAAINTSAKKLDDMPASVFEGATQKH